MFVDVKQCNDMSYHVEASDTLHVVESYDVLCFIRTSHRSLRDASSFSFWLHIRSKPDTLSYRGKNPEIAASWSRDESPPHVHLMLYLF